jgi:hypothetical protein
LAQLFQSSLGTPVDVGESRSVPDAVRKDPLFHQIERFARNTTTVRCHITRTGIHLEPNAPEGLPISVYRSEGRQTVCIGEWYDDVDDDALVLRLVEKVIHGQLRLRIEGDGRNFHTFIVEVQTHEEEWIEVARMANCQFHKSPVVIVKYLCNDPAGRRGAELSSGPTR